MAKFKNAKNNIEGDNLEGVFDGLMAGMESYDNQDKGLDKKIEVDDNSPMKRLNKWQKLWSGRILKRRRGKIRDYSNFSSNNTKMGGKTNGKIQFKILGKKISLNLRKSSLFKYAAVVLFLGLVFLTLGMVGVFAWYSKDLPHPDKIVRKEGFATKIYDRNDVLLYEVYADEKRIPVNYAEVPDYLKKATVAIEDKDFYNHKGFDPLGYLRIVQNALFRGRIIGGSTLTQQIVKNVLLSTERTLSRKIKELVLAIQIERKYSKEEILNIYLNESPYGGTAWGVVAAAEMYFGKQVKDLTLVESAILAGMPQSPSGYSPYGSSPEAYKYRTADVLRRMREDNYITQMEEEQAMADLEQVQFAPQGGKILAPHFVMYVKNLLEERYGENLVEKGGLTVKTTLDYEYHKKVQEIVTEEIEKVAESEHITNGAVTVVDPQTGQILAMVGSKNYFADDYDGKVNVTTSLRQPGSSIKPVTYATALANGFTPESMIMDVKTEFPGVDEAHPYIPKNYNGQYNGPVSLRNALGSSLNVPAVKLLALVGVEKMMQLGYDMGISTFEPTEDARNRLGLSVTLGGGEVRLVELTAAYSTFANKGYRVDPISILEVKDNSGNSLEKYQELKGKQILTAEQAFLISHMLADNNARLISFGANSLLNIPGRTVSVKTGTTDDKKDNWAIGWTPQVVVGVWVGNNDNTEMGLVASGVSGASPIWRRAILAYLDSKPVVELEMPKGIKSVKVDRVTGYPAHDGFEEKDALVIEGSLPSEKDPYHVKLKVCEDDNKKLAPETAIAKGDYDEKEFFTFYENDPLFGEKNNRWQKAILEWMAGQGDERYHPPTEYCESDSDVAVRIEEPDNKDRVDKNKFIVEVKVGVNDGQLDKIKIFVDDEEVGEIKKKPYELELELKDGTYKIKAVAYLKNGETGDHSVKIGVNKDWDWVEATPTPEPTSIPTPTPTSTLTPVITPSSTPDPEEGE